VSVETDDVQRRLLDALCDPDRLRVAGRLAERSWTVTELAGELGLKPQAVVRHFSALEAAGLIRRDPESPERSELDIEELHRLSRELHPPDDEQFDGEEQETARILRAFFKGDQLTHLPVQRSRQLVVLRHLAAGFEPGVDYPEREVNEILGAFNPDFATLRRALVDEGFLERERGVYWRAEEGD
jgi:DNA-binding HxlR family transcriptional regulator